MDPLNFDVLTHIASYITLPKDIRSFELVCRRFLRAGQSGFRFIWTPLLWKLNYKLDRHRRNLDGHFYQSNRTSILPLRHYYCYTDRFENNPPPDYDFFTGSIEFRSIPIPNIDWLRIHPNIEKMQYPFEVRCLEDLQLVIKEFPRLRHLIIANRHDLDQTFGFWINALQTHCSYLDSFDLISDDGLWSGCVSYFQKTLYITDWANDLERNQYYTVINETWPITTLIISTIYLSTRSDQQVIRDLMALPIPHIYVERVDESFFDPSRWIYIDKLGRYLKSETTLEIRTSSITSSVTN